MFLSLSLNAQTKEEPWQFFVGINAIDTFPTGAPGSGDLFEEFLNIDHWNIAPYPSFLGVKKYVGSGFSFGTRFSFNTRNRYGDTSASDNYYNVDGIVSYNLNTLFKGERLMPFLELGGGYSIFDEQGAGYFNLGAGLELWLGENKKTAIILESLYKNTGETYGVKHFQHLLGVAFLFGGDKDSDQDGIPDKEDECPNEAGTEAFNGCLDTDGDGISDLDDKCPNVAGLIENEGCPDTTEDEIKRLQEIGRTIFFKINRSDINAKNDIILQEVFMILTKNPNYLIEISGHMDSVGSTEYNQGLSERRANSVAQFLIDKGLDALRITSRKGYGEEIPVESNETAKGRSANRRGRVEFKLHQSNTEE